MRFRFSVSVVAAMLLVSLQGSASATPPLGFLDAYTWQSNDPLFGGFSGLELTQDGLAYVALSDRGGFTKGQITRDSAGRIAKVTTQPVQPLLGRNGAILPPKYADSEGLALAPDGTFYVSFEGVARVLQYPVLGGTAQPLPIAPAFPKLGLNSSLEALAIGPDGTLYTLPEQTRPAAAASFPVYRFKSGKWDSGFAIARQGGFLPVGADFDPQGRFYLLERAFHGIAGFASRIRRFDLTASGFTNETTLMESSVGLYDNLEGLSIWRNPAGHIMATMVSDDNFSFFQRTQLVEFQLPD